MSVESGRGKRGRRSGRKFPPRHRRRRRSFQFIISVRKKEEGGVRAQTGIHSYLPPPSKQFFNDMYAVEKGGGEENQGVSGGFLVVVKGEGGIPR